MILLFCQTVTLLYFLLKKLLKNHTKSDVESIRCFLSFSESILIIVDRHRNIFPSESLLYDLIDELARILKSIHSQSNLLDSLLSKHAVSIVWIRRGATRDDPGEYPTSEENDDLSIPWHIVYLAPLEYTRSYSDIEAIILIEYIHKFYHIIDIHLSISIESHDIFPSIF